MKPTQAQLDLAGKLEVDVPGGTTKFGLSMLLDGAIKANRASKRNDLPNEVAVAPGLQHVSSFRIEEIRKFRESGIHIGNVVLTPKGQLAVVLDMIEDYLVFRVMDLKSRSIHAVRYSNLESIYRPPTTFIHPLCAFPRPDDVRWVKHKPVLLAFVDYAEPLIEPTQVFRNEHGVFWNVVATADLKQKFLAIQDAKNAPPPDKPVEKRFCVVCGKGQLPRMFSQLNGKRCVPCSSKRLLAKRFCHFCGQEFVYATGSGRVWYALMCGDCKVQKMNPSESA